MFVPGFLSDYPVVDNIFVNQGHPGYHTLYQDMETSIILSTSSIILFVSEIEIKVHVLDSCTEDLDCI